ncbi:MAG: signal peptidase II [Ruminococcus sp.]|jgi:signal peptidase II|nr:signal peptidase II [Ruminococcus sp.]
MIIGIILSLFAIAALTAVDLYIKDWAVNMLAPVKSMDFIKFGDVDLVGLYYTENTGAAFSFFNGSPIILTIFVSILLVAVAAYGIADKNKHPVKTIALIMILAGGLGNLIDRIKNGYVVDYLEFRFVNFAIFNFADVLVTCGAIALIIYIWVSETSGKRHRNDLHNEVSKYRRDYDR